MIDGDGVFTHRLFWLQSSADGTVQIIDHYVSSTAHIFLADCTLYDIPSLTTGISTLLLKCGETCSGFPSLLSL